MGKRGPAGLAVGVNCMAGEGAHFTRTAVWLLPAELHVPARPLTLQNFHSESLFHTAVILVCDLNEHRDRGPLTHLYINPIATFPLAHHRHHPNLIAVHQQASGVSSNSHNQHKPSHLESSTVQFTESVPQGEDL